MKPIVALVGRPNVGKSTLFNRLTRTRGALVDNRPGVTRDRHFGEAEWFGRPFTVVDTGGFLSNDADPFAGEIRTQILAAVEEADVVVVVLDGKSGLSFYDRDLVELLRDCRRPVLHIVNKIDGEKQEDLIHDFYELGIREPLPVSAEHGYGIGDFIDAMVEVLPNWGEEVEEEDERIKLAVVGRPNAGKSSLVNRMLSQDRMVVSDVAGTTRDSIDAVCKHNGREYLIVDTAGIRRKGKVDEKLEKLTVIQSLRALERCDVALIVLDAAEGITEQDVRIAGYAEDRGCAVLFVLNKWDLVPTERKNLKEFIEDIRFQAKGLSFAPAISISALTGQRVTKIYQMVETLYKQYTLRIGTGEFNRILESAVSYKEPSLFRTKRIKFFFGSQIAAKPPTFLLFANYPEGVHFSYKRYLINRIREALKLDQVPIRLKIKEKSGRIDFSTKKKTEEEVQKLAKARRSRKRRERKFR